ncbi:MAG: hypothetical protein ACREBN_11495 [Burkholderiaceae bacterium]
MNPTPRSDEEVTRRYRDASDELGEAPSAAARAAILAAAARQVQSRPVDAMSTVKQPSRSFARWPLGAAAAVLLSTLAVLMADRTEREIATELASSRTDSAPAARSEAAKPVPSAPAVAPAQDPKAKQDDAASAEVQQSTVRREAAPRAEAQSATPSAATTPARPAALAAPAAPVAKSIAPTPPPPAAAAPAPTDAAPAKATADTAVREQDRGLSSSAPAAPSAAIGSLRKNERERAASAQLPTAESPDAPASNMAGAGTRTEEKLETSAAAWLERITELRRKGEDEQADAELKKFRERYPAVVIPAQAQRAVGTR